MVYEEKLALARILVSAGEEIDLYLSYVVRHSFHIMIKLRSLLTIFAHMIGNHSEVPYGVLR